MSTQKKEGLLKRFLKASKEKLDNVTYNFREKELKYDGVAFLMAKEKSIASKVEKLKESFLSVKSKEKDEVKSFEEIATCETNIFREIKILRYYVASYERMFGDKYESIYPEYLDEDFNIENFLDSKSED